MDLVRRHDIEDSVLFDISEHKPLRRKSIKLEPLSPSSSPSLDVSSESDSVQKVPSLDNLYDEASLGGKCVLFSKKHSFFSIHKWSLTLFASLTRSLVYLCLRQHHRLITFATLSFACCLFAFTASGPFLGRAHCRNRLTTRCVQLIRWMNPTR